MRVQPSSIGWLRKRKSVKTEQKIKWWKLRKEEYCEDLRMKVRAVLGHAEEFPDDWETTATVIREKDRKVLGMSSGQREEDKDGDGIESFSRVSRQVGKTKKSSWE